MRYQWGEVEGLRVGRFNLGVNTTFVVCRLGATLIETGPPNCWNRVRAFAQEGRLDTILVTHHHEDHSGNGGRLSAMCQARVLAPERSLPLLRQGYPMQFYRRQVWGAAPTYEAEPLPLQFEDPSGNSWQVIAAPGHADDMVVLLEKKRGLLFSADLYVATRVRFARPEDRLNLEIESLQRAIELPFEHLICAHRGLVERGHQALRAKLDYLVSLRQQVRELHAMGWSVSRIQRRLLGREGLTALLTGWHFCKANLIRACLG